MFDSDEQLSLVAVLLLTALVNWDINKDKVKVKVKVTIARKGPK